MTYERFSEICLVFLPRSINVWHLDDTNGHRRGCCRLLSYQKASRMVQIENGIIQQNTIIYKGNQKNC